MKKVFLLTLGLVLGFSAFAQRTSVSNDAKNISFTAEKASAERISDGTQANGMSFTMPQSIVKSAPRTADQYEEMEAMITNYDLQSNSALGNRIATWPDGTASFVATWDHSGNTSFPDRGTGYNYYNGHEIGDMPEARQEPMKSGWPAISPCGDGELLASHATGVNLYYRPTKGEGEWTLVKNWGAADGSPTWPRVVVSGPNDEYIHVVMCKQISIGDGYDNHIYYSRITRNGDDVTAWEVSDLIDFPGVDNDAAGEYRNQLSADDYVMASNGDDVAVMFSAYTVEVFYMISHDNGETWERQIIAPYPVLNTEGEAVHAIDFEDYPEGMVDTIHTSGNAHSLTIDDNGVVHATFDLFTWKVADSDSYNYWPVWSYGLVYWNSEYVNERGGHELPLFGDFSGDAAHPEWEANGVGHSYLDDRIWELAEADGHEHLHLFGYVDEDGDGTMNFDNVTGLTWHYRSFGWATMPSISIDNNGNIAIIFSAYSEVRLSEANFHMRTAFVEYKMADGEWSDDEVINLMEDFEHSYDEAYATVAATNCYNGEFFFSYSCDLNQGLYLDIDEDNYPTSNGGVMTDNTIFAIRVVPAGGIGIAEVVNPMTSVRAYPNPATDVMNLEINAAMASEMTINIYNITGQNVMNKTVNVTTGVNNTQINVNELGSGVYFCSVNANGFNKTVKVIVK